VSNVFGSWQWNYFISAPVFSTLVSGINSELFNDKSFDQQAMVNAACDRVKDTNNQGYYPLSWQVIAQMTLNGEVAKAGAFFHEPPIVNPTKSPVGAPINSPTKSPTKLVQGCFSNNYKNCLPKDYNDEGESCNKIWLPNGAQSNCIALWGKCKDDPNGCCGSTKCHFDLSYAVCVPTEPSPTPSPTPTCIICDDKATNARKKKGKDCANDTKYIKKKCNKNSMWSKKKFCQLSCFKLDLGYEGDVCCTDNASRKLRGTSVST